MQPKRWIIAVLATFLLASGSAAAASITQLSSEVHEQTAVKESRKGHCHKLKWMAEAIGMPADALRDELLAGKSPADVAKEKGISRSVLIDKLTTIIHTNIDHAVKNGKIPTARGDALKQRMKLHLERMVDRKGLPEFKQGRRSSDNNALRVK